MEDAEGGKGDVWGMSGAAVRPGRKGGAGETGLRAEFHKGLGSGNVIWRKGKNWVLITVSGWELFVMFRQDPAIMRKQYFTTAVKG